MPTAFDDLLTDSPPKAGGEGFDDLLADAPPQEPLETAVRSAAMAPGQSIASAYSGLGQMADNLAETAGKLPGPLGPIAKGAIKTATAVPRTLGPIAGDIANEAQQVYNPDSTRNPMAAAVGSGVGQALPMAASAIVAGPAAPLALGAGQGADQGIQQAEEMGIRDPAKKLAMGGLYAGAETLVEKMGGFGSEAFTAPIKRTVGQAIKEGVKTVASETLEEPFTGAIQDAIAARFAPEDYDLTSLAPFIPDENGDPVPNPAFWTRRKLETAGGFAGGAAGAGVQTLHNATLPRETTEPGPPPAADVTPDPLAAHAATMPEAAALPDYTQPGPVSYDDPGAMWSELLSDQPPPMEGQPADLSPIASVTADATPVTIPATSTEAPVVPTTDAGSTPATGGNLQNGAMEQRSDGNGLNPPLQNSTTPSPPPASSYRGPAFGSGSTQNTRETPVIPDAPYGGSDLLDWLNDNTIAVPADVLDYINGKKGAKLNKEGRGGDYDFLEKYEVPKGFRKYLFSQGDTGNINEVAAMAHDEGLIDEPTPDALMAKILETINAREQYTFEVQAREKQMATEEKQHTAFDTSQRKLGRLKTKPARNVPFEQMFVGDRMKIDGEDVEVLSVETDEDGYPQTVTLKDGAKFGVLRFDASNGQGVLVNEWKPRERESAPEDDPFSSLVAEDVQGYLDLPEVNVPAAKQPAAQAAVAAVAATSNRPYQQRSDVSAHRGADRERQRLEAERDASVRSFRGLINRNVDAIREAFKGGNRISNLIHRLVTRDIPGFDIKGAIIESPQDFAAFNLAVRSPYFESLKIAVLGDGNQVIHSQLVHVGALAESIAHPQSVFGVVEAARAANPRLKVRGFIIAHNHPSGDPSPSDADHRITRVFQNVAQELGVPMIDHVVTNGLKYFSFREVGLVSPTNYQGGNLKPKLPVLPTPNAPGLGNLAPWEAVQFGSNAIPSLNGPDVLAPYIDTLRTADPDHHHLIYVDTRNGLRAVERVPITMPAADIGRTAVRGTIREGAAGFMLGFAGNITSPGTQASQIIRVLREMAQNSRISFYEAMLQSADGKAFSYREQGLLETPQPYTTTAATDAVREEPGNYQPGPDEIHLTHEAERQRMDAEGKDPLPTGGQGTVDEWEAEARARVQEPGAAQALVSDIIEKQRTHTPVEYYMLMHYAGALDAQIEKASRILADPISAQDQREQAATVLSGLNTERDRIAVAAQLAGSKAGAALGARSRGLDRAIIPSLSKMVADLTLIDDPTGRRPLAPEERARIEKIHADMTAKAAAVEKQDNQASQDSYHNELKKLLDEARAEIEEHKETIAIQQRALDNKLKPATLLTKTKATLDRWANEGDAALERLRAKGFFAQANMGVDPSVIMDAALLIRGYMSRNAMKSADAAAIILKKLGKASYAALEKFLPQILDTVKQIQQQELKKTTREGVLDKARKDMPKPGETAKVDPTAPPPSKSSGKLDTLQAVARKLALSHITDHIERGDKSMSAEKIAELVRADLEEFKPGITTREARDLISGYGDVKLPSKDIARKTLRDFRAQMQKLTQLEALLKQERLLKSGVQRDQPSARLRELQKQVEELKRETGYESRSREDELKSQRDRIKTSLNNQIEELQRILAGKARPAGGKERVIYDAELQSLQTMRNALKELVAEMPEHKRASEERRNKAAIKAAKAIEAEFKRRIAAEEWHARRTTPAPSAELTAAREAASKARAEFEKLKKQKTGDTAAMKRAAAQLEAANKRVAEWQRRARESEWTKPGAKPKEQGGKFAQVEAAKAMARQARADFEALKRAADPKFNPDAVALRQFKQRIEKQIADLEARMKAGDFEPRKKTPREIKHDTESTKLKHDLQQAKRRWIEMQLTHKLNNFSMPQKAWWNFRKAFHTARSIMTGGEFSGLLRQGLLKTVSHPIRVMRNDVPAMLKAFRSETGEFSVLSDIMARPNSLNGRYRTAKLALHDPGDFSAQMAEGNARSEWANKIPFIAGTGRAYTALLNHMRADLFDMMVEKLETKKTGKGQTLSEAELKAIADFVNDTTGAGKLGVIDNRPGAKDLLGMLIFSPAFVSSRIRTLFGASLIGGSMDTRQAIAGEYLRITAGMAAVFALAAALQSAGDDEPEDDPRSSNFGKVQYGKTAVDFTAGLGNTAVMIARTLMGEIKKSNGTIQPTRGEGVPYGGTTAGDVVSRWMRSKLSPGASFAWNRITGTDYSGKPASLTTDTANLLRPITYNDVAQIWREQPASRAIPLSAAAIFGLGTQTRNN